MEEKLARIRYDKGDATKPNTMGEHEGFLLERWDGESWCLISKVLCVKSTRCPDADSDYIHWSILIDITRLSEQGYKIRYKGE